MHSSTALHFDVTTMSLASRTELREALAFAYISTETLHYCSISDLTEEIHVDSVTIFYVFIVSVETKLSCVWYTSSSNIVLRPERPELLMTFCCVL